jgi:5'-3' exonuclease
MHVLLIDGNNMYRIFHGAMKDAGAEDSQERSLKAMEATQSKIFNVCNLLGSTHACVFFDGEGETWRHQMHPTYKYDKSTMQPKEKPQAMTDSIYLCQSNVENAGIKTYRKEGLEADDGIATIANALKGKDDITVTIVSNDKDFCQLYEDNVRGYQPFKNQFVTEKDVKEKYGYSGGKFLELLTLAGDDSDNIPGVAGVKEKTAKKLLDEYGSIENMKLCSNLMKGKLAENFSKVSDVIDDVYKRLIDLRDMKVDLDFKLSDMRTPEQFRNKNLDQNQKKTKSQRANNGMTP